ncbi:hypothetical protein [Pannonibacter carbonis]|uniref:hypothetical protein n=1 Tax=Pannonibacter carbonis TaxID=2067569 RepID=UPI0013004AFA|nr:hypothetical protein [Pannonibacter carbonis]
MDAMDEPWHDESVEVAAWNQRLVSATLSSSATQHVGFRPSADRSESPLDGRVGDDGTLPCQLPHTVPESWQDPFTASDQGQKRRP